MSRTMSLYACGGFGVNIAKKFLSDVNRNQIGFADIEPYFIDTSDANIKGTGIPNERIYIVKDEHGEPLQGSGKLTLENSAEIRDSIPEILLNFKPGDINVVLHSAHGGSGTVAGRYLVSALNDRGIPVIVVCIGGTTSKIEARNTRNCLMSYENIATKTGVPVICSYSENTPETPRSKVDKTVMTILAMISAVFSGDNRELDNMDLVNFLNYTKVTSYEPRLALLEFFTGSIELGKNQSVITAVSLLDDGMPSVDTPVEYLTEGYVTPEAKKALGAALPVHAAVINGFFQPVIDALKKKIDSFEEIRGATQQRSIVDKNAKADEDGMFH